MPIGAKMQVRRGGEHPLPITRLVLCFSSRVVDNIKYGLYPAATKVKMMTDTLTLRPLTQHDLSAITAIHMRAFPRRALSALGEGAVLRYYTWLMDETHTQAYRMGAVQGDRLVGFNFAGRFNGAMGGFLARNRRYLTGQVLRRPWLLVTNELFRERAMQALSMLSRRRPAPASPHTTVERAAYQRGFGILAIAVDPAAQGGGVGRLLMADAEAEARRRGVAVMNLSVAKDNVQAIAFYERIGWHKVIPPGRTWDGVMHKVLPSA
jgi:ribosomal protein S18 acetylase RimI-like enzyme